MKTSLTMLSYLMFLSVSATTTVAATISFDDVPNGTNINNKYTDVGVTFSSVASDSLRAYAVLAWDFTADLGHGNVISVSSSAGGGSVFAAEEGLVKAEFSTLQSAVSIDARMIEAIEIAGNNPRRAFLEAFNSAGGLIGSPVYYPFTWQTPGIWDSTDSAPWITLTVTDPTASIAYVLFSSEANAPGARRNQGGIYAEFDNLRFASVPEPATFVVAGWGLVAFSIIRACRRRHYL
jgi:hypothetical protein